MQTSIRNLRSFLGTFAGSLTCWVIVMDISLLLFTIMIFQLLLWGGGENFFSYANAQACRKGRILWQDRHDNKGLLFMVAPL
jgi:hypothetical protein